MDQSQCTALAVSYDQFIELYNSIPQVLSAYAIAVNETAESYRQQRQIQLEFQADLRGKFWIVQLHPPHQGRQWYLIPQASFSFHYRKIRAFRHLFEVEGEIPHAHSPFFVESAAQVTLLPDGLTWRAEQTGRIQSGTPPTLSLAALSRQLQAMEDRVKQLEQQPQLPVESSFAAASSNIIVTPSARSWSQVKQIQHLTGHEDDIRALIIRPWAEKQKNILISGSHDKTIKFWFLETGEFIQTFNTLEKVQLLRYSADSRQLAIADASATVALWDLDHRQSSRLVHQQGVVAMAFVPQSPLLVSYSLDRLLSLWDLRTQKLQTVVDSTAEPLVDLVALPDGQHLITSHVATQTTPGVLSYSLKLWNLKALNRPQATVKVPSLMSCLTLNTDASVLAAASSDRSIHLRAVPSLKLILVLAPHRGGVQALAFHPENEILATGDSHGEFKLWHWKTGDCLTQGSGRTDALNALTFSPEGDKLVTAGKGGDIHIWGPDP
ncbi:WD40 repeat domain-containing protein [Lyngbya confervoides]|uniref:WD40 repeat domain-containing protein n=1 Tax=Lyngbya confervoides BDU141951 TaxID=1574623 RepID=A0ABD4T303_9CYAN|nr:WD40 repeat domain-containing protein [Lyngbya confervoides]MCM1982617.1 WD40 repeat domain-containing protein [Lyngbya confervoides BDU141951]